MIIIINKERNIFININVHNKTYKKFQLIFIRTSSISYKTYK